MSLSILVLAGCSRVDRKGVLSQELPLTLGDIAEIRAGEENHKKILELHRRYENPHLEAYANAVAATIAKVSTRPHLPYKVILLDLDEVNIFGGPGGYIYITRGLFNFIESESELAGLIAHEIGHISRREYAHIPQHQRIKFVYKKLVQGSEFASDAVGTYGTAMNKGLKVAGKVGPHVERRFALDAEVESDKNAVDYLMKAGYDPRGFQKFIERLSRVEMGDVNRFVNFLNTHPPFPDRRVRLNALIGGINFEKAKIEFKQDKLSEIRQVTVNAPDSILFRPVLGVHEADLMDMDESQKKREERFSPIRRRWAWF